MLNTSNIRIPKDQTSLLKHSGPDPISHNKGSSGKVQIGLKTHRLVNSRMKSASGAVHLIGSFSLTTLILLGGRANPKSATFGNRWSRDFQVSLGTFSMTLYLCSVKSVEKNIPERGQIKHSSLLTVVLPGGQVPRFSGELGNLTSYLAARSR